MAIAYKSAGSGVSTETSGAALSPACPATVDAGDILIAHVFWEGTTTAPSTPSGWTLLDGPEVIETTVARHWVFGKVADGTEDGATAAFGSPAVTTQRAARIYSFSGRVSGDISLLCQGFSHLSHATDPQMPTVTTVRAGALAVALVAQNDNNATGNATGESGGNWTEAVAEYTVALTPGFTLQLQTCTPTANPGTVSGGSVSTTNDPCGVIGFYIQDVAETPKSATDTVAVGVTDAQTATMASIVTQDTLSGFNDDWRLLTDSDSFTYHNRIDSLVTRLNGAATETTEQTVNGADSLAVTLTESASVSSSVSASDSVACVVSDDGSAISSSANASDSISVGAEDVFSGSQAFTVIDVASLGLEDAGSIASLLRTEDSLRVDITDTTTQLSAVLVAVDSLAVQCGGIITSLYVSSVASDSAAIISDDVFTGSQSITVADTTALLFGDAINIESIVSCSDAVSVGLDDVGALSQVTISASESLAAVADDIANIVQNTLVSVSENVVAGFSESATIINALFSVDSLCVNIEDVFTGSQALGVSDDFGFQLSEDQSSSLLVAALDGVATSLSEAASVYLSQDLLDSCAVQLGDVGSRQDVEAATPKSAVDSCGVAVEEGAVTELAGPYWTGTLGEDRGLVYADSYAMGRRENPGRMRW